MTVSELIALLDAMPRDAEIAVHCEDSEYRAATHVETVQLFADAEHAGTFWRRGPFSSAPDNANGASKTFVHISRFPK